MNQHSIKLGPKLFDLFQHCELKCNAACCGWDAFALSDHWLSKWCEYRDREIIQVARDEIGRICSDMDAMQPDAAVWVCGFFDLINSSGGCIVEEALKMIGEL